jgi:hypothetical protein
MKKTFTLFLMSLCFLVARGQVSIVVLDSINDGIKFKDNALLFTPAEQQNPLSSYVIAEKEDVNGLKFPAITLSEEANGEVTGIFKSWASFDYIFPRTIDRNQGDTVIVEFDMIYNAVGGSGEGGRVNVSLLTDLPKGGITPTDFGKPAYHFWIFNGNYSPCLSYGGEFTENPGWNSGAGGYYYNENAGDPLNAVLYPTSDNYPLVPYSKNLSGALYFSATQWKHYTLVLTQDMMVLYWRNTGEGPENDEEIIKMAIPKNSSLEFINQVHGTFGSELPPAYKWYESLNGIRFFNRGSGKTNHNYISNLKVTKTGKPVVTYAEFQNRSASQRRPRADAGSYQLPILLFNGAEGGNSTVTVELVKGDPGHVDNFTQGTVEFTNTTEDMMSQSLNLTIKDIYKAENDTLLFAITKVEGGDVFATPGPARFFELVIRSSGATSVNELSKETISFSPNPARDQLHVSLQPQARPFVMHIFDITGKLILSDELTSSKTIDVSGLQSGIYYIRLAGEDGLINRKIIKQ